MTLQRHVEVPSSYELVRIFEAVAAAMPKPRCTVHRSRFMRADQNERAKRHANWSIAQNRYEYEMARLDMTRAAGYLLREVTNDWQMGNFRDYDIRKSLRQAVTDLIETPAPTSYCLAVKRRIARKRHHNLEDDQLAAILAADEAWLASLYDGRGKVGRPRKQAPASEPEPEVPAVEEAPATIAVVVRQPRSPWSAGWQEAAE